MVDELCSGTCLIADLNRQERFRGSRYSEDQLAGFDLRTST
jgi:hypothetical protein